MVVVLRVLATKLSEAFADIPFVKVFADIPNFHADNSPQSTIPMSLLIEQFQNHGNQKLRNGPHPNRHVFVPDCLMLQVEFLAKSMPRLINS